MKKILFLLCLWLINTAQAQWYNGQAAGDPKIIAYDNAEANIVIPCQWCTSKRVGWTVWSGGTQDVNNQASTVTIRRLTQGQRGAPAPRKGLSIYEMMIKRDPAHYGLNQYCRSELYWGNAVEFTDCQWQAISMYIPANWCDQTNPVGVAFDNKFANAQGPASFYLKIDNGQWQVNRQWPQGGTEWKTDLGPVSADKGVWTDWVLHRNYKDDGTGFMTLYKNGSSTPVWTWSGANYVMSNGSQTEGYILQGIYKWSWQVAEGDYNEGPGNPACETNTGDSIKIYYDEIKFGTSQATLADMWPDGGSGGNLSPTAAAGANQDITLPTSTASFTGSGNDPDGTIETIQWTKVSGPAGGTINAGTTYNMNVTGLSNAGTYIYRLTVTDDESATGFDDVQLTVNASAPPPGSGPAFSDVGGTIILTPNETVLLPKTADTLSFYAIHPDEASGRWVTVMLVSQLTGPNTSSIGYISQAGEHVTTLTYHISGLIAGTYTYRLSALDDVSVTNYDTISVFVIAATNDPPVVNAGADQTLTLDGFGPFTTKSTTLIGTATDSDGSIALLNWQVLSGPENSVIGSPANDTTSFAGLLGGTYTVRFTATDNNSAFTSDDITVRVLTCNAGVDQTVQPLVTTTTLVGSSNSVTDTTDVLWTKISGTGGSITSSGTLTTGITGLTAGSYVFELTVTHTGGYVVKDRITVTVLPGNVLPTVNAGTDITLALDGFGSPTTQSTTLRGVDSDADGTVATATWSIVSGPAGSVFGSPTNDTTTFTNLIGGTYVARLTVVDNSGGSSFDDISVRVITVSAGADQGLVSTTTSITLTAISNSVSDTTDVLWTKISGTGGTITSNGVLSTTVTGLTIGAYVFQVQVTHTGGYITKDQVAINIAATEANNFYQLKRGSP